ncbi:hypothetical protein [Miltoncostaea marina]|uniref:hypothetical protein n=1 Tax=Miltoncostaea marina TaxID=2843215 RepID=UPI001C3CDA2D|nr:hypothetical protein [Miltoncostaea marina]
MRPLSPAAFELRAAGAALLAAAAALGAGPVWAGGARAAGLGLCAAVAVIALRGAAALRRATRLALPVLPAWELEPARATLARVALAHAAPATAGAAVAGHLLRDRAPGAPAAAAGALAGAGLAVLLGAARVRRAERALGRRLLREPGAGLPLGRRSLHLEPLLPAHGPRRSGPAPWTAHRPPAPPRGAAIELEPANGASRHPVGVRTPRLPPGIGGASRPSG